MIRIGQLKVNVPHTQGDLEQEILKVLKIKQSDLISWELVKQSVDARKKPQIKFVYTVDVKVKGQESVLRRAKAANIQKEIGRASCRERV